MEVIGLLWNEVVVRPMANSLVFLYSVLGNNFGVAIIAFTLIVRLLMLPLTMKQLKTTKNMQQLQPKLKELQEKYGKDRQRFQQEQMKLFKTHGVSPLGCLGPIFIQMPIWIGLFYAIRDSLADTPEGLLNLSQRLYSWVPLVHEAVPLSNQFLWMDLAVPDPSPFVMPVLVGASMWVVQKMSTIPGGDPRQNQMNSMMMWMWPLLFGFWTLSFPSGLAVYWVVSNVVSIAMQYPVTGWGGLVKKPTPAPAPTGAVVEKPPSKQALVSKKETPALPPPSTAQSGSSPVTKFLRKVFGRGGAEASTQTPVADPAKEMAQDGKNSGDERKDRRGSNREGTGPTGRKARRHRHRRIG